MLPILSRIHAPSLAEQALQKVPWFELYLFRTLLRFRQPKPNVKIDPAYETDRRPFVNTASKSMYYVDIYDETLYPSKSLDFYRCLWSLYPRRWLAKPYANLGLFLDGVAVTDSCQAKYPDVRNTDCGLAYLIAYKNFYNNAFAQFQTIKQDGSDYLELNFRSAKEVEAVSAQKKVFIEPCNINGHQTFKCAPEPNVREYFFPFTAEDFVCFQFTFNPCESFEYQDKPALLKQVNDWVDAIINTVELIYPERNLDE